MSTMYSTSIVPAVTLNDGHSIPQLGFGVFQIDPEETAEAVGSALDVGYRHIDTAEMYRNECGVGEAVRASGLDRGEVFITSKLNNRYHRPGDARRAFETTLAELGFDYVDLFLIHWPLPTPLWWRLRINVEDARGVPSGRARALDRRVQLPSRASRTDRVRQRPGAGGQPDRGSPVFAQRGGARVRRGARDRHRGVVADRAGRHTRRPGDHGDRRPAREVTGTGGSAVAHPTRQCRLSQVHDAGPDQGELRAVRFSAGGRRH